MLNVALNIETNVLYKGSISLPDISNTIHETIEQVKPANLR